MFITDPVGDMLTRIRNGGRVKSLFVQVPYSKLRQTMLDLLYREGYIRGYQLMPSSRELRVLLKYVDGAHVIRRLKRISRPGCRRYISRYGLTQDKRYTNTLVTTILSTTKGVISSKEAYLLGVGGEVMCIIE